LRSGKLWFKISLGISKITIVKWTGGVAQAKECLLCKHTSPEFKLLYHHHPKKNERRKTLQFKKTRNLYNSHYVVFMPLNLKI
jgi:hypothetical protein